MNFIKDLVNKNFNLQDIKDLLTLRFPLNDNNEVPLKMTLLNGNVPIESNQNDQIIYNQTLINADSIYRKTKKKQRCCERK